METRDSNYRYNSQLSISYIYVQNRLAGSSRDGLSQIVSKKGGIVDELLPRKIIILNPLLR